MMNDLKTGLKLMRYAYGIKTNCIQAVVFLLAGLVLILSGERAIWWCGAAFSGSASACCLHS